MAALTAIHCPRPAQEIDAATLRLVSRLARRAGRRWGLSAVDREALAQDLLLDDLRRQSCFDPSRVDRIAEDRLATIRPVPGIVAEQSISAGDDRDLAIDFAAVLRALPARLRALCEHLETGSVADAGRRLGVPRATVRRDVKRLREFLNGAGLAIYLERRRRSDA